MYNIWCNFGLINCVLRPVIKPMTCDENYGWAGELEGLGMSKVSWVCFFDSSDLGEGWWKQDDPWWPNPGIVFPSGFVSGIWMDNICYMSEGWWQPIRGWDHDALTNQKTGWRPMYMEDISCELWHYLNVAPKLWHCSDVATERRPLVGDDS